MTEIPKMGSLRQKKWSDGILDAVVTRFGLSLIVGILLAVCVAAGLYLQSVLIQVQKNHATFNDSQVRNGYVAMSDLQRLLHVAQAAASDGEMSDALSVEFASASDILFVRIDNFQRQLSAQDQISSGQRAISALENVINVADKHAAAGFPDVVAELEELLVASETARVFLVQFLDNMRRQADEILAAQSLAVREQQVIVLVSLTGMTIVGSLALLFLRREVIGRRAREQAEERVEFLAFYDPLTLLPNRVLFQDRLQSRLDARQKTALLYIDLDDFKAINDTFGHAAGDAVLTNLGRTLASEASKVDGFAARLAGDEFALVVPNDDLGDLDLLCTTIIAKAGEPTNFDGETLGVTISVGLATTTHVGSEVSATVDKLSRVTDFALYASKADGGNRHAVYDEAMARAYFERRALIDGLPDALARGDLEIFLQPKVRLPQGSVYGFEALIRWNRSGRIMSPDEFIDVAEQSGFILEIDEYVLNHATIFVANWNRQHGTSYSVSVNLSALHFCSRQIVDLVEGALASSKLPPQLLTLEITETVEMRDWNQARRIIADMHEIGCKVAIDDFGSGFSSLAYLRVTSADELKIDRSLVEELGTSEKARALLISVLEIARNLEMDVTIEGIETSTQAKIIYELGALTAQGFYFGRPEPANIAILAAMAGTNTNKPAQIR